MNYMLPQSAALSSLLPPLFLILEMLDFEKILAYYQRMYPEEEEEEIENEIFSHPEYIFMLLGLKRIEEELQQGEGLETFLEKSKEELKKKIFYE